MHWWSRQFLDRVSIKVLSVLYKVMTETDFRTEIRIRAIKTPTLILHGDIDKSAALESTGRPTHELIAGSWVLVYENAAHALPYTRTDRMLADIVEFAGPLQRRKRNSTPRKRTDSVVVSIPPSRKPLATLRRL